jgi:ligand-binding SRPBCC domain-containing protein
MKLCYETVIKSPVTDVFAFYNDVSNLPRIMPPSLQTEIIDIQGNMRAGTRIELLVKWLFFPIHWIVRIEEHVANRYIVDVQEKGPLDRFRHRQEFVPHAEGALLRDEIEYELPFSPFSLPISNWLVKPKLDSIFAYRHAKTKKYLEKER